MSRSATIVIVYLMAREKLTLKDAIEEVRAKRTFARPNKNFFK
jgi:protein-tyrosine phosphatase